MVLLHLAEEALRDLESLPAKPDRAIHSLRTRVKNLRAIFRLVQERVPRPSRKAIVACCKVIKGAFSRQRDAHAIAAMRLELGNRRHAGPQSGGATEGALAGRSAIAAASRLIGLLGKLRLDGLGWDDVLDACVGCYREARKAFKDCRRDPDPKLLHAWRRPVKDLFYQSRVLQPLKGMKRRVRRAQRLGERLGRWNDLQLLTDDLESGEKHVMGKRIAKERKALKPLIFKAAAKLFSDKPGEMAKALERCVKMLPAVAANCARQA
jgi:CHAD domain-containing protein